MFCPNCGTKINDNEKFCFNCGAKIDNKRQEADVEPTEVVIEDAVEVQTEDVVKDEPKVQEESQEVVNEAPVKRSNRVIYTSNGTTTNPTEVKNPPVKQTTGKQTAADKIKEKAATEWGKLSMFGKVMTVLIAIMALLTLVALIAGKIFAMVIAIIQIALIVVAWLMKAGKIKQDKKWLPILLIGISVVLFVPYFAVFSGNESDYELDYGDEYEEEPLTELEWPGHELAQIIPIPKSNMGRVDWEYDDEISIYIGETSFEDYEAYIEACKEAGFTNVTSEGETFFYARNAEGYRISLTYNEDETAMKITVEMPLYKVVIEIDCAANLIFSRYNVVVNLDYDELGTIEHGKSATYDVELEKGSYTLEICKEDDEDVVGTYEIEVTGDGTYKFEISCHSDQVKISEVGKITCPVDTTVIDTKSYTDVVAAFENAGFTNVKTKEVKDLEPTATDKVNLVSSITVDGKSDFTTASTYFKEVEVVIEYHAIKDISMTKAASDYVNMNYADVEAELKALGFTNITSYSVTTTDKSYTEGAVSSVEIKGETFSAGAAFAPGSEVTIAYWTIFECEYEKAFVRAMSNYSIYYMFDTDNNKVITFSDSDTYVDKGTYSGSFSSGVTIKWDHGQWTETFKNSDGSSYATMIDGNGFDWEYKTCDLEKAQGVLDSIQ